MRKVGSSDVIASITVEDIRKFYKLYNVRFGFFLRMAEILLFQYLDSVTFHAIEVVSNFESKVSEKHSLCFWYHK